jgi:hypothetical protein
MRISWLLTAFVALLVSAGEGPRAAELAGGQNLRNPFGVPDVINPDGKDVHDFAKTVKLSGDANDPNAEQWVKKVTAGQKGSIEGEWQDRWNSTGGTWNYGEGPTQIKVKGDKVFILVNAANGKFLIEAKKIQNKLVGKYQGVDAPADTGPCVFLIADDERIDGNWAGLGRWDFRRKLK